MKHLQKYNEGLFSFLNKDIDKKWLEELYQGLNDSGIDTRDFPNMGDKNLIIKWRCIYKQHEIIITLKKVVQEHKMIPVDYKMDFYNQSDNVPSMRGQNSRMFLSKYATKKDYKDIFSLRNMCVNIEKTIKLIDNSPESERYQSEKKRLLKLSEDMSIDDIKDIISDLNDDIGDPSSIHFKNGHYYVNYDVENLKYLNTNPMISDEYTRLINKLNDIHNKTKELYGASLFMQLISDNKRLSLDITREI